MREINVFEIHKIFLIEETDFFENLGLRYQKSSGDKVGVFRFFELTMIHLINVGIGSQNVIPVKVSTGIPDHPAKITLGIIFGKLKAGGKIYQSTDGPDRVIIDRAFDDLFDKVPSDKSIVVDSDQNLGTVINGLSQSKIVPGREA